MENGKYQSLRGKRIILGVCSSIAVYKAAELTSQLVKAGAHVDVVMTENACKLMSPRIFQTLSHNKVYTNMWEAVDDWKPEHVGLAENADLLLVAPATANIIGCFANGLAPDMLSTLFLATRGKVLIAPAMNTNMLENTAVVRNIEILSERGVNFVEPACGLLACGVEGRGKLAEVSDIIESAAALMGDSK